MQMPKYCPNCEKPLELKLINLESAILLCTNLKCPYPVEGECIILVKKSTSNSKEEMDLPAKVNDETKPQTTASLEELLLQPESQPPNDLDEFVLDLLQ